ncbi:7TM chemoreceptor [Ostertagia ostertagi]
MFVTLPDIFYMVSITANGILSIFANCFLLYMIIRKSPPQLTPYRIFLANTAITQLSYAAVMIMVEPKIFSNEMRIVVVYLGPAQYFGPWVCYMLLITMLHLAVNSFISIMLSMIFRCIAIRTLGFPTSAAYVMCALGYFIPLTMVLGVIDMEYVSDYESNTNYMNHTVNNLERYRTVVGTRIDQALTVQSIIPLFTVFPASISFMLTQFGMVHYHFYCYFITSCLSVATLVDPIVTIYYVSPYRRFVKRCLGWSQKDPKETMLRRDSTEKTNSFRKSFKNLLHHPDYKTPVAL